MRIGTRGSALALAQAGWVAERLAADCELVAITTSGDRGAGVADKSRWVSELERALLAGEIELAVHSAKDVPAELAEGLELIAIPARADARDAICGAESLAALRAGARVGTSSLRRAAQLRAAREDIEVVDVRGNVDTRLRKLDERRLDALVLALAGLQRLGRAGAAGGILGELVPAAGQGALALEAPVGAIAPELVAGVADNDAWMCVTAERELTRALGASCNTPVGAHARLLHAGELELSAWVGLPDGSEWVSDCLRGAPQGLGAVLAARMLSAGAGKLLRKAARGMGQRL
jgi:hydroxymethylbilane synthase